MKTRGRKHFALLACALLLVGGLVLAGFREKRQYAMNRALIGALNGGELEKALDLVKAGADPNTRVLPSPAPTWNQLLNELFHHARPLPNNSPTALMVVCGVSDAKEGIIDFGRFLVSSKAPPTQQTLPIENLKDGRLVELANALLLHGANINARDQNGRTALMAASMWGLSERMSLLLQHGALVDLQDDQGNTALNYAVWSNQPKPVELLLQYHANANLKNKTGRTLLHIHRPLPVSTEIIRLLKAAGATQ